MLFEKYQICLYNLAVKVDKLGDAAPANKLPVSFVFHGGSGSDVKDIREAITYGVIKMNIDTDTQWSYWEGIKNFETKYHDYLQGQIGNPEGRKFHSQFNVFFVIVAVNSLWI